MKKKFLIISLFVLFVIVVMFILFEKHCTYDFTHVECPKPCVVGSICIDVMELAVTRITTCTTLFGDVLGSESTVFIDSPSDKMMRKCNL